MFDLFECCVLFLCRYGEQSGYMLALSRECDGSESDLTSCLFTTSNQCSYQQTQLVGVVCSKVTFILAYCVVQVPVLHVHSCILPTHE